MAELFSTFAASASVRRPTVPDALATAAYTAFVYSTTSGRIVGELPLAGEPDWSAVINGPGSWKVTTVIGAGGGPSAAQLRQFLAAARFSVAVCWGEFVCQAGPITTYGIDDTDGVLTLGGPGLWGLLNKRLLTNPNWNPSQVFITDPVADTTITDSLPNIAKTLIRNAVNQVYRPGSALPLDVPANSGTGDNYRQYFGYDLVSVGQRLQELTQVQNGPDVLFAPYKVPDSNYIRHRAMVGEPLIVQGGAPVFLDYGANLQSLSVDGDGSAIATGSFVKGSGNERAQMYARLESTRLIDAGWPMMDYVDTSHSDASDQSTLDGWAKANLDMYGGSIETWSAVVRAAEQSPLGTYYPGWRVTLNVTEHVGILDGQYASRILGIAAGQTTGELKLTLEQRGGVF